MQFLPTFLKIAFQVSDFVLLILFQRLGLAGEVSTGLGTKGDLALLILQPLPRVAGIIISNLETN